MVLYYAARSPTLPITVVSPPVSHVSEILGYAPMVTLIQTQPPRLCLV